MCRRTRHLSDSFRIAHYLEVFQGHGDQRCWQKLTLLYVLILWSNRHVEVYEGVLKRLLQCIWQVRPELYWSEQWNYLHNNARLHTAIHILNFLAQRKITVLPHPPHAQDLVPADFFLFPCLKLALKGLLFTDVADIKQRMTMVLWEIPQEAFADSFQQLYNQSQKCVVANGEDPICSRLQISECCKCKLPEDVYHSSSWNIWV